MHIPSLDFHLGETIEALRDTVQAFAANEIAPRAADVDRTTCSRPTSGRSSATSACTV